jgi:ribonuclease P protein component
MLPKSKRLTTEEIESLHTGKSVFGTLISMRMTRSDVSKFAVSVSKKVAPLSVDRNRLRRRVYSALSPFIRDMKEPVFAMFMPKKELLSAPIETVRSEIAALFKKAGLI